MNKETIDRFITNGCLPAHCHQMVEDIVANHSSVEACSLILELIAEQYRQDPDHPRYDQNRANFPKQKA